MEEQSKYTAAIEIMMHEANRTSLYAQTRREREQADAIKQVDKKLSEFKNNDPVLYHALMYARDGCLSDEYAYKIAVIALVEQNKILLQQIRDFAMSVPIPAHMIADVMGVIKNDRRTE